MTQHGPPNSVQVKIHGVVNGVRINMVTYVTAEVTIEMLKLRVQHHHGVRTGIFHLMVMMPVGPRRHTNWDDHMGIMPQVVGLIDLEAVWNGTY